MNDKIKYVLHEWFRFNTQNSNVFSSKIFNLDSDVDYKVVFFYMQYYGFFFLLIIPDCDINLIRLG